MRRTLTRAAATGGSWGFARPDTARSVRGLRPLAGALSRAATRFFIAALLCAGCSLSGDSATVTGFVQSSKTDDNDIPIEGFIWDGQTQYNLEKDDQLESILENVDRKVKVQGEVREDWDGNKWIKVEKLDFLD